MMEWLCIGDSITERNFRTSLNYHDYVAPRLGLEVLNEGFSGTGFLRDFEGNVNYLKRLRMIEPKPGIVTVMGSFNDCSLLHEGFEGNFEKALEEQMDKYFSIILGFYPTSLVAAISPSPWCTHYGTQPYVEIMRRVSARHCIPFLDLCTRSPLRPWEAENNRKYFSCAAAPDGDGVHPNELGHKLIAARVEAFLRENWPFF